MRTRQQRLADERAGHSVSPPQVLADNPRGPRRTRAKTPSATVAAGSAVPAAQLAAPEEPQALVQVWVDSARAADDPSHQLAIPSALIPELLAFINSIRDQGRKGPVATFPSSSAEVTPSLGRLQFATDPPTSRTKPQLPEISQAMAPDTPAHVVIPFPSPIQEVCEPRALQPAPTGVVSPFQETFPPMTTHASSAPIEQPFQVISGPMAPLSPSPFVEGPLEEHSGIMAIHAASARVEQPHQEIPWPTTPLIAPAHVQSPGQEAYRPVAHHNSPSARIEAPSHPVQSPRTDQPICAMPQIAAPALAVHQALPTSHSDIVNKQTLVGKMPEQQIRGVVPRHQTEPVRKPLSSSKRPTASGPSRGKRRLSSRKLSAPPPIKRKLSPVPSDPETLKAAGIPSMFRNHSHLPAYAADGSVLYGPVAPSDDHMKFLQIDEASANPDSDMDDISTPQTPQATRSVPGRLIRSIRSVKRQFGFSPLTMISERSEFTPPTQPAKKPLPPIRFPSRTLDRMNQNKRKRWTSPETIPNPEGTSYGLEEVEFYGNAEEDEEESGVAGRQPDKFHRTSQSQNFSRQGARSPDRSRPWSGQQFIKKTPVPITNLAGTFKVPSPGDSDWSDSESEDEGSSQAAVAPTSTITNPGPIIRPQFTANAYEEWRQTASPAVAAVVQGMGMNPITAGQAFGEALNSNPHELSSRRPQLTAYEDWRQTASPAVAAAIERMDVDHNMAGAAFKRGLDNFTTSSADNRARGSLRP